MLGRGVTLRSLSSFMKSCIKDCGTRVKGGLCYVSFFFFLFLGLCTADRTGYTNNTPAELEVLVCSPHPQRLSTGSALVR